MNRKLKDNIAGYLFIAPNLLGLLIFTLFPILFSLVLCFTNWNLASGISGIKFAGLDNFKAMASDKWFTDSLINNLIYTGVTTPIAMILALSAAISLNNQLFLKKTIRTMFFLPYVTDLIAVSAVWMMLFHPVKGPINQFLMSIGVNNPPLWLASTKTALISIMVMSIWGNIGYLMIIYLAGLQGIPQELYEAARMDGASKWNELKSITIPMLTPTTFFLLITSIINSFNVFAQINVMTDGGPGTATTVLAYYIYIAGFRFMKMGYAAAMAWVLFIIVFLVTMLQWKGQKKWVNQL